MFSHPQQLNTCTQEQATLTLDSEGRVFCTWQQKMALEHQFQVLLGK